MVVKRSKVEGLLCLYVLNEKRRQTHRNAEQLKGKANYSALSVGNICHHWLLGTSRTEEAKQAASCFQK